MARIYHTWHGYAPGPTFTPLLDNYPDAKHAYSFRKLTSGAAYSCRVRRSSDNAEQDIGFDGEGLDTAALLSFVGAGNNGYIRTLYDQVGSVDLENSFGPDQLAVVELGALVTGGPNGLPCWKTFSVAGNLFVNQALITWPDTVFFTAYAQDSGTRGPGFAQTDLNVNNQFIAMGLVDLSGTIQARVYNFTGTFNPTYAGSLTNNELALITGVFDTQNKTSVNGGAFVTGSIDAYPTYTSVRFGLMYLWRPNSVNLPGRAHELIIMDGDQSASRAAIESNINTYYTIY